ncbi:MAG: LysE family translocator [Chthoniobacterales bacterium]
MNSVFSSATILNGLLLGWSVAWPPGPVNAEIIRRGVMPPAKGGGFWPAMKVGLGACVGDFLWALGVSAGAGALIDTPGVRVALGVISLGLLFFLAAKFTHGAWRIAREQQVNAGAADAANDAARPDRKPSRGFLLGFSFALTSPWNIGFWLAVVGSQAGVMRGTFLHSLVLAATVILGALAWAFVLGIGVKLGARVFSRPSWQIATQILTAIVMLYFALRLVLQLREWA